MKVLRDRKYLFVLLAMLVVFAACKGESPTAPTTSTTGTVSGGSGTPPTGATITLTVSNATPLVSSTSVITATVSSGGNPVSNGTAVEFTTTLGQFTDTGLNTTIRTTTNGVATVTVTSAVAGTAQVTAIVNNVTRSTSVTFQTSPTTVTPPSTAPTITSVNPNNGLPTGGQTVTITGTNFRTPVRVIFDLGGGQQKDAFVSSVTPTVVTVVTPQINLVSGQTAPADVIVIDQAGTPAEVRVTSTAAFTYRLAQLTPVVSTVSPDSGPISGGTRITIFGSGFEAPVQVSFAPGATAGAVGWDAIQVLNVTFNQITAITPAAADVNPTGSGSLVGTVDLRVHNITSNTEVIVPLVYRYTPKSTITAISPGGGSAFGGTQVTIDGTGFVDPVTVAFDGIAARIVRVSGTEIVAVTGPTPIPCTPPTGPAMTVGNVANGDTATGPAFAYQAERPQITNVSSPAGFFPGNSLTVTVFKPGVGADGTGSARFTIAGFPEFPSPTFITDPVGPTDFVMTVPTPVFATAACTLGGVAGTLFVPFKGDIVFLNVTTGCTDTLTGGISINPPLPNACTLAPTPPAPAAPVAVISPLTFCPNGFGSVSIAGGGNNTQLLTIENNAASGAANLAYTISITGAASTDFTTSSASGSVAPGTVAPVTLTFKPTVVGLRDATLTVTTNDPTKLVTSICLEGTGTP